MIELIKRLFYRDGFLFFTHTPRLLRVGSLVDDKVITRIEQEMLDTALQGGGAIPCFKVYGRRRNHEWSNTA